MAKIQQKHIKRLVIDFDANTAEIEIRPDNLMLFSDLSSRLNEVQETLFYKSLDDVRKNVKIEAELVMSVPDGLTDITLSSYKVPSSFKTFFRFQPGTTISISEV